MDESLHIATNNNQCNEKLPLDIHPTTQKKKLDMSLSLGKVVSSTDQTPTPVRFFRTCDEMGLFQDLNPFEETFRKAVEAGKTGDLPKMSLLNAPPSDDTLNTPHIFPVPLEHKISLPSPPAHPPPEIEKVIRTEADTSVQVTPPSITDSISDSLSPVDLCAPKLPPPPKQDDDLAVLLRMADGRVVQLAAKPFSSPPPEVYPSRIEPMTNERRGLNKTVIITTQHMYPLEAVPPPPPTHPVTPNVKEKLKQALLGSNKEKSGRSKASQHNSHKKVENPPKRPSESENSESDSERKKRILERNRVAAMKCREKKKKWIEDLGRKANIAFANNHALNQEVNALRAEVAQLKSLLLLHKDCPVTLAAAAAAQTQGVRKALSSGECGAKRIQARERLSLNIEEAKKHVVVDLDSPLIRSDHVLSSVAPKTPTDPIPEVILDDERPSTVIQLNPNALRPPLTDDLYS